MGAGEGAQVHHQRIQCAVAQGLYLLRLGPAAQLQAHVACLPGRHVQQAAAQQGMGRGAHPQAHGARFAADVVAHHLVQFVGLGHDLARMF